MAAQDITVQGAGWASVGQCGRVRLSQTLDHAGLAGLWNDPRVFARPVKSYGRFDLPSRLVCVAAAMALQDACVPAGDGAKRDVAVLGANTDGCLDSDRAYFQDYASCGRTLARGNLFLYTLPSSPFAEAAIHFGLEGPLLYLGCADRRMARLIETAAGLLARGETGAALLVENTQDRAVALVLGRGTAAGFESAEAVLAQLADAAGPAEVLERLAASGGRVGR